LGERRSVSSSWGERRSVSSPWGERRSVSSPVGGSLCHWLTAEAPMLGWLFPPSCPCDPAAKAWVEERLQRLSEEFDDHAFNGRPLVLPTQEFFPDSFDGSKRAVRALLDRVCGWMDVVPELVALRLDTDPRKLWLVNEAGHYLPHAAGTYKEGERKFIIRIDTSELDDAMGLVGTMAHELAHVRLMGESRVMREAYDNELLTDLTVVCFGLGIFLANSPRNWVSQNTKWPGTDLHKPQYMTPPMFGYALAHLAWFRGEEKPAWAKHLRSHARPDFKQALRFLLKTGDSTFRPKRCRDMASS
jgi:hypothetical protein